MIKPKEISEEEQLELLEERRRTWKQGESRDGFIETWREKFTYKGISFELVILRYYTLDEGFKPILFNRVCDRHVVVEYPDETKPLVEAIKFFDPHSEFLYHDTLHDWNNTQNIEEQIEEAYRMAIEDIDNLGHWFAVKCKEVKDKLKLIESKIKSKGES